MTEIFDANGKLLGASQTNTGITLHDYMLALWRVQTGFFTRGWTFDLKDGKRITFDYFSDEFTIVGRNRKTHDMEKVSIFDVMPKPTKTADS